MKGNKEDRSDFRKVSTMADYTPFYMHRNDFNLITEIFCRPLIGRFARANQRAGTYLKIIFSIHNYLNWNDFDESLYWFPAEKN